MQPVTQTTQPLVHGSTPSPAGRHSALPRGAGSTASLPPCFGKAEWTRTALPFRKSCQQLPRPRLCHRNCRGMMHRRSAEKPPHWWPMQRVDGTGAPIGCTTPKCGKQSSRCSWRRTGFTRKLRCRKSKASKPNGGGQPVLLLLLHLRSCRFRPCRRRFGCTAWVSCCGRGGQCDEFDPQEMQRFAKINDF